ncbi:MAG: PIN domain-containing protein [Deltaproteobacteria bacterium]|nr:PIN domain-containing protein [Deltaproteobacteria bacterium]
MKQLLSIFSIIPYNDNIEQHAILIRINSHLKIPDAYIVGTALDLNEALVTNDK